ncbi:MAG: hypothetical protein RLZZ165_1152 [Bacteroidota bacterium]|jgi:hypothetical protein
MHSHVDRKSEKGRTTTNLQPEGKSHGGSAFQFVDNRPEAITQRKLQEAANNSPKVKQMKAIQEAANNGPRVQQLVASAARTGHGSTSTVQRKEKGVAQGHSSHASNSPVAQLESYLDLRGVSTNYADERIHQRPDLRGVVELYGDYIKRLLAIINSIRTYKSGGATLNQVKNVPDSWIAWSTGQKIRDVFAPMPRGLAIWNWTMQEYHTQLEKARLQDIPIDDHGNIDPVRLNARLVEYDTTAESQDKTKVGISGGALTRSATHPSAPGAAVDTTNSVTQHTGKGWEIFVMGPSGNLHMASHKIGKYHHSSLLGGGAVAGAGTIKAVGGQITHLNDKSGHYRPSKQQTIQVCHMLKKQGVDLSTVNVNANGYNGPGHLYLTTEEENTLEAGMTQRTLDFFIQTKGLIKVRTAFMNQGWSFYEENSKHVIRNSAGKEPAPQEVRQLLQNYFKQEATPTSKKLNANTGMDINF